MDGAPRIRRRHRALLLPPSSPLLNATDPIPESPPVLVDRGAEETQDFDADRTHLGVFTMKAIISSIILASSLLIGFPTVSGAKGDGGEASVLIAEAQGEG